MGGFLGVVSTTDCVNDLFFGTDYHSHLGTKRGGMAVMDGQKGFTRFIHDITNAQFRSKLDSDLSRMKAIKEIEGDDIRSLKEYANPCSEKHCLMVEKIRKRLNLTSLKYQKLDDLVTAIGLPKKKVCTYCGDGAE